MLYPLQNQSQYSGIYLIGIFVWCVGGWWASNVAQTHKQRDMIQPLVQTRSVEEDGCASWLCGTTLLELSFDSCPSAELYFAVESRQYVYSTIHPHVQLWMAMKSVLACLRLINDWDRFSEWKLSHCSEADIAVLRRQLQKTSNTCSAMPRKCIIRHCPITIQVLWEWWSCLPWSMSSLQIISPNSYINKLTFGHPVCPNSPVLLYPGSCRSSLLIYIKEQCVGISSIGNIQWKC